jgi:hypothetical protein
MNGDRAGGTDLGAFHAMFVALQGVEPRHAEDAFLAIVLARSRP